MLNFILIKSLSLMIQDANLQRFQKCINPANKFSKWKISQASNA